MRGTHFLLFFLLKTAYQTSQNRSNLHVFWSIWWCLVCSFWSILKLLFILFFSRVRRTKKGFFGSILSQSKLKHFVGNTFEENVQNTHLKIGQKLHTKHQKMDQIFMFFDRFDDVWYAVFDQFWNEYFVLFSQGYYQQNYLIFIDSKWIQKRLFLYVIPLGKIR